MYPNAKGSELIARLDTVPLASTAAGTVTSGWVSVHEFRKFLAVVETGTLGTAATVDAKIQQASDSSGTGAKDVTGKAITQLVKASNDNDQALINLDAGDLDTANNFNYFRLSVTVGTATSVVGGAVYGVNPVHAPASDWNNASVVQVV